MSTTHDTEQQFSKSTLFCPTCEHASPIEGDWIMDDAVHRERLLCPRCGDVVDQL
jgi:ribosomal protein S27AE